MRRIRVWMCWWSIFRLHSMLSRKSPVIVPNMNTMSTMAPFTQTAAVSVCGSDCMPYCCSEWTCVSVCVLESVCSLFTEIRSSHKIPFTTNSTLQPDKKLCFSMFW